LLSQLFDCMVLHVTSQSHTKKDLPTDKWLKSGPEMQKKYFQNRKVEIEVQDANQGPGQLFSSSNRNQAEPNNKQAKFYGC